MTKQMPWRALALANTHPTKMAILQTMLDAEEGDTFSPNSLSKTLGQPLGNVSYHVKGLLDSGLIVAAGTEPRRGAVEHFYALPS